MGGLFLLYDYRPVGDHRNQSGDIMKPRNSKAFGLIKRIAETPYNIGMEWPGDQRIVNVARDPNLRQPPDEMPEWFNALQEARKQPKRQPAVEVPLAALLALSFSTGACLGLLVMGVGL